LFSIDVLEFGAVLDTWPWVMPADNFNAGVLSLTPSVETYSLLVNASATLPIAEYAEQGVLNHIFPAERPFHGMENLTYPFTPLPFKYNLNLEAYRSHRKQWDEIWPDVRVLHYTAVKPKIGDGEGAEDFEKPFQIWWQYWDEVRQKYGWTELDR
jgi:hypothetical protein